MKKIDKFITEYIIKKKLDTPIDSEHKYYPNSKEELIKNIQELISNKIYDFNCIDTSEITDMSNLFDDISVRRNFNVSKWNVSNVKYINCIFNGCKYFDCDLSKWDVSNVENMLGTFSRCENFNGSVSGWNVSKIKDMMAVFYGCNNFTGNGLETWDVSNVEDMQFMFYDCKNLNCDLSKWNVSNVADMDSMFNNVKSEPNWYKY